MHLEASSRMRMWLRGRGKRTVEVAAVLGAYVLFFAIGACAGQTTMSVEILSPPDGMRSQSSPLELAARVTIRGVPVEGVTTRFTLGGRATGEGSVDTVTDALGIARIVIPASSGNYTWFVTATKDGYPKITSRISSFSIRLLLLVDALLPATSILAVSPVDFKARVTDVNRHPVDSANVTFYVDSIVIGWSLTPANGIAKLSSPVAMGEHVWFASANKDAQGGLSNRIRFLVGQRASPATDKLDSARSRPLQLGEPTGDSHELLAGLPAGHDEKLQRPSVVETHMRRTASPWK